MIASQAKKLHGEGRMSIEVGSIVTWRHGKSAAEQREPGKRHLPLGIAGCEVLALGLAQDGRPAAALKLPPFFGGLNEDACNGYVADLELE